MFSVDVPTGEPDSSGGNALDDDPTGDNCPLCDGLDSFVLHSNSHNIHLMHLNHQSVL